MEKYDLRQFMKAKASSPQAMVLANPPILSENSISTSLSRRNIWGGVIIGILTVFLVVSFYHLCKRKFLPALRGKPMRNKKKTRGDRELLHK